MQVINDCVNSGQPAGAEGRRDQRRGAREVIRGIKKSEKIGGRESPKDRLTSPFQLISLPQI